LAKADSVRVGGFECWCLLSVRVLGALFVLRTKACFDGSNTCERVFLTPFLHEHVVLSRRGIMNACLLSVRVFVCAAHEAFLTSHLFCMRTCCSAVLFEVLTYQESTYLPTKRLFNYSRIYSEYILVRWGRK
jgi:hypothetical protein